MNAIQQLQTRLNAILLGIAPGGRDAPDMHALQRAVEEVRKRVGERTGVLASTDRVERAASQLLGSRESPTRGQAFLLAHAFSIKLKSLGGRSALEHEEVGGRLLAYWEAQARNGQLRPSHWRGLFFSFLQADAGDIERLRGLLKHALPQIERASSTRPDWLENVLRHQRLLSRAPTLEYAQAFVVGNTEELKDLQATVEIPPASWLWVDLIRSIGECVGRMDLEALQRRLPDLLQFAERTPGAVNPLLAACLQRLAQLDSSRRNEALLQASLKHWGSPQLLRNQLWTQVSTATKQMVCGWLAQEDLEDFYRLCKDEKEVDDRRLKFWLRFKQQMTYTMILLGPDLRSSRARDVHEFIKRKGDRLGDLTKTSGSNNAILMCIGGWLFVEFSQTGNACYAFKLDKHKVELGRRVYQHADLRRDDHDLRLLHTDRRGGWEESFLNDLERVGIQTDEPGVRQGSSGEVRTTGPSTRVAASRTRPARREEEEPFRAGWAVSPDKIVVQLSKQGFKISDRRPQGGTVWVLDDEVGDRAHELRRLGMRYKQGKGYYL
ncbi:MAG: hypothetical protein H4O13_14695 [Xanthomonadales bacterium]|nr:hypothetical protein [Xanthomonadales bacterium]